MLYFLWIVSMGAAAAGTLYWCRLPADAPNRLQESFGLVLLYLWTIGLTILLWVLPWWINRMDDRFCRL